MTADDLARRLRYAAQTAQNDDLSQPETERRRRHVERIAVILEAAEFLSLSSDPSPPEPSDNERGNAHD